MLSNEKELAEWIAQQFSKDWCCQFILKDKKKMPAKGKPSSFIIAAFQKQYSDLSSQYSQLHSFDDWIGGVHTI